MSLNQPWQNAFELVSDADNARTSEELVASSLIGNDGDFALLVERHMPMVYRFAYRYLGNDDDASDIAQETFIRAWKHLKKFDTKRNFKTWILAIAKNASLDFIKKKKPILFSRIEANENDLDAFLAPHVEAPDSPSEMFERKSDGAKLHEALEKLPLSYRTTLTLRYGEHLKFREIAEILKEPIDTVKSKHRRGLIFLRKLLPENEF